VRVFVIYPVSWSSRIDSCVLGYMAFCMSEHNIVTSEINLCSAGVSYRF